MLQTSFRPSICSAWAASILHRRARSQWEARNKSFITNNNSASSPRVVAAAGSIVLLCHRWHSTSPDFTFTSIQSWKRSPYLLSLFRRANVWSLGFWTSCLRQLCRLTEEFTNLVLYSSLSEFQDWRSSVITPIDVSSCLVHKLIAAWNTAIGKQIWKV